MVQQKYFRKHLVKIKKIITVGGERINLAQGLLCSIALGEKLSPAFSKEAQQAFRGLRRYKFVRHVKDRDRNFYVITPKGEEKLKTILIDEVVVKKQKKWDGKWHLVIYDLPIRFKKARNAFRFKLKDLGFFQFQKSAWIYPYPCEGEILFVADFFGVRKHIQILEVDKISDDKKIREYFDL